MKSFQMHLCFLKPQVLEAGVARKVMHADFGAKWQKIWTDYQLQSAAEVLNSNDYPNVAKHWA